MAADFPNFCRQFATMVSAGLPISRALEVLSKEGYGRLGRVAGSMHDEIARGSTLTDAASQHPRVFSKLQINMFRAGEKSGHLESVLYKMAETAEKQAKLKKEIVGAMIYPTLLLHAGAIIPAFITWILADALKDMDKGAVPEPSTNPVMMVAAILGPFYFVLIMVLFLGKYGSLVPPIKWLMDAVFYAIPFVGGTIRKVGIARFARTFDAIYGAGLSVVEAVGYGAEATGNAIMEHKLKKAQQALLDGRPLAEAITDCGAFNPMINSMIATGEESGKLDEMFEKICENAEFEAEMAIKRLSKIIPGLIYACVAIWIGMLVIGIFGKYVNMLNTLGG